MKRFLDASVEKALRDVRIITGKGIHSQGGQAKLRPAILKFLKGRIDIEECKIDESNAGCILVRLKLNQRLVNYVLIAAFVEFGSAKHPDILHSTWVARAFFPPHPRNSTLPGTSSSKPSNIIVPCWLAVAHASIMYRPRFHRFLSRYRYTSSASNFTSPQFSPARDGMAEYGSAAWVVAPPSPCRTFSADGSTITIYFAV